MFTWPEGPNVQPAIIIFIAPLRGYHLGQRQNHKHNIIFSYLNTLSLYSPLK